MKPVLACGVLVVATAACSLVQPDADEKQLSNGLDAQMQKYVHRIKSGNSETLFTDLTSLSAFGRHASEPVRVSLLSSDSARIRSNAVYVLSEIYRIDGDPVALEMIQQSTHDRDPVVRLEAARALLEMGDRTAVPELIEGLRSPNREIRYHSGLALGQAAGNSFGYNPDHDNATREAAIRRFQEWHGRQG